MSGIADVARLAGVSKSTASRALSGAGYVAAPTRARVREVAAALGYRPSSYAVGLATGRTHSVGVVVPQLGRWFVAEVLEGIRTTLGGAQIDLALFDADREQGAPVLGDVLSRGRFDGLLLVGVEPGAAELERLRAIGHPVVAVVCPVSGMPVVGLDERHAARRATDHLLGLGHTRIAFLGGGEGGSTWVDRQRWAGYTDALEAAGASAHARHVASALTLPGGYAAAADLLSDAGTRPTAIVGVCDEVAIGAIIAARRLGLAVPGALSIVGIDDHEYADMFALTTLAHDPRAQGTAAARILLRRLADPTTDAADVFSRARLVVRASTAAPDAAHGVAVADGDRH